MPTNKPRKSAEKRAAEARMIRVQLEDFGFPSEALATILTDLEEFSVGGESLTKEYKLRELGVTVLLQLSVQPHVTSFARLRKLRP